jgi:L-ascorbate metabolism protein UlaG (beta-lactamase superfamily)
VNKVERIGGIAELHKKIASRDQGATRAGDEIVDLLPRRRRKTVYVAQDLLVRTGLGVHEKFQKRISDVKSLKGGHAYSLHCELFVILAEDAMTYISNNAPKTDRPNRLTPAPVVKGASLPITIALPGGDEALDLTITRITHACVLLRWGDRAILTDPWFSQKPLYYHGESLPLEIADLPLLSAVLSSMNHYDHFDIATFSAYRDLSVPLVTIKGSRQATMAKGFGFNNVHELAGWASLTIGDVTLHAIPANRFAPNAFRYEQAYIIHASGRTILFCAHYLKEHALAEVKARFPKIDLALLGINGLRIKPLMGRQMSMDPIDAARLCAELRIPVCVPIHYAYNGGWFSSTFVLSHKGTPEQFSEATRRVSPGTTVITLPPGQPLRLRSAPSPGGIESGASF